MLEEYYQLKIVDSCSEYLTKTYLILNLVMWVVCIKKDLHICHPSTKGLFQSFYIQNLKIEFRAMWKNS